MWLQKPTLFRWICLLVIAFFLLESCSNPTDELKQKSSVTDLITSQPNLSIFKDAIEISGLSSSLSAGNRTFFAPTNTAFEKYLLDNNYSSINAIPVASLKELLLNHFMNRLLLNSDLYTGYFSTMAKGTASASANLSLYVGLNAGSKYINGNSKIITADIIASNGIIHVIDNVLLLPTILAQLTVNPNFTDLLVALTSQNQSNPLNYFKTVLSDTTTKTFFAPTNDAFIAFNTEFGYTTTAPIASALQNQILRYHIATGNNYFLNSFTSNQIITTNQMVNLTIQLSNTSIENYVKLKDANNRLASITFKNIQCTNGIIHIIDNVLKP